MDFGDGLPPYDENKNYYAEYWKLYLQNEALLQEIEIAAKERNETLSEIVKIEVLSTHHIY